MSRLPERSRSIFPTLLSPIEKDMLTYLSTASGLSMSGVVRQLILKETAHWQLVPPRLHTETKVSRE
ncbi:MAG: hypothetical protein E6K65_02020 [Nitrospirae bacterium]|nr:MAG: hypothetical protein E6K65_02020 [Nitrospirota bacterium]